MQFIDLKAQQQRIRDKIESGIHKVLNHGKYIMGPEIFELEEKLGNFCGVKHAISCSSGTDALLMALMAFDVKPGDAIFTTPFTFIATAEAISLLGAVPVFVDIDPKTYNISPTELEKAILALKNMDNSIYLLPKIENISSLEPKGIIAVDLFGLPADYDEINDIAKKYDLFVIEDAAQSFGADYNGRKSCSLADIACTSFFPAKPLGCYGDGGMCFTDMEELFEKLKSIRIHGKGEDKYDNIRIGVNGRMDTIQAAILIAKFNIYEEEITQRQRVAGRYTDLLCNCDNLVVPKIPHDCISVWAQYSVLAKDEEHRSLLIQKMKLEGIPSAIYYPKPLHLQTAFQYIGYEEGSFPVSEDFAKRIFSLPMHPYLNKKDQTKIVNCLYENQ